MTLIQIIETTLVVSLLFTVAGAIRRIYFHPLSHIPGPKLAALTWWYEFYYDIIQPSRYVFQIQELHKEYGPIIRITPDELHINDVGFLDNIYAPSSSRRDKYAYQLRTLRVPGGIGAALSHDVHKGRRDALSPFFSKRNVLHLEPLITQKLKQLCELIRKHANDMTPINLSDVFFAFCNDVVNNFLFAHQTDVLANEEKAATLRHNTYELLMGINVNKHFPWIPDFLESLPMSISRTLMPPGLLDLLALFNRVRGELLDIIKAKASGAESEKHLGPTGKESVFSSVLDSPSLPPAEKSLLRLEQEGALLVLAGTESPAKTLTVIFYHLLANPILLATLRNELLSVQGDISWTKLEQLPYLSAVIEEGNRLSFGVTARTARISHEALNYAPSKYVTTPSKDRKSYNIPAGTPVSTTTLSAHTAETVFPDPFKFDPDRWLGHEGKERKRFQMAFNKGSRKCLGIELARAELFLVTAKLVREFGVEMRLWETGSEEVAFVGDYQVAVPAVGSKGVGVMVG
ncbi:cytochrome P450 [Hyaloscypha variabilis F]|uniref:Cytochrome P450 n=1 Tax=Hyaloscypha variabilis (strain UAMH 11265 / GT02V1 / F) TaxID=1149755 RepID=A0A2J6SE04_HYAVF|nr:cytochrome P450 [Hyaloscypha variabilis F]